MPLEQAKESFGSLGLKECWEGWRLAAGPVRAGCHLNISQNLPSDCQDPLEMLPLPFAKVHVNTFIYLLLGLQAA